MIIMSLNLDKEFAALKKEYLHEIEDQIEDLRSLLEDGSFDQSDFRETYRIIHSLKGGAASYELTHISTICHYFEDFLSERMSEDLENEDNIEACHIFYDIIVDIVCTTRAGNEVVIQPYIDQVSNLGLGDIEQAEKFKGKVLVVDNTKTMGMIVKSALKKNGYDAIISQNGLVAFNRAVTQKFDALITSINLDHLDGISLITAIKCTNNLNANIPTLVISASQNIMERFPSIYKPEKIVIKNEDFVNNFQEAFNSLTKIEEDKTLDSQHSKEGPTKILYVEDDTKMQKLMTLSMKKTPGVELSIANNLKEALSYVNDSRPDIILLDNFLKDETGHDVFKALQNKHIPCLFLTASESAVPVTELKKHKEFLGIITKPFRPNAIYGQIKRFYNDR